MNDDLKKRVEQMIREAPAWKRLLLSPTDDTPAAVTVRWGLNLRLWELGIDPRHITEQTQKNGLPAVRLVKGDDNHLYTGYHLLADGGEEGEAYEGWLVATFGKEAK